MKKRLLLFLLLLCLGTSIAPKLLAQENTTAPAPATPENPGKITGSLTDSLTRKPVEFATVALLQKGTSKAMHVMLTDNQGRFSFSGIPFGEYNISITFIGYQTKLLPGVIVTAAKPHFTTGTVLLSLSANSLKEVNVQALRPVITQEADKMVVSVEGTALAAGATAYDVLARAPGVFIDQEGNIQLNGRSGVTVMLNGRLTYLSARDLRNMLEGMSAENLKNIEIITNPSAKYDAEGSSGILNINLKKNEQQGMNGSVYAGYTYNGRQHGYTNGGNINYKTGRWNSFLHLDMARRVGGREATFTRVFYAANRTTYFDQTATGNYMAQGPPAIRVGTDYNLTDMHSVGIMANYTTNYLKSDFLTDTYLGNTPDQPQEYIDANNYMANRYSNYTTNLHYAGKLDSVGTLLSADLDFVKIRNRGDAYFYNYFDDLTTDTPPTQDFLYTDTPNGFDIYAAKIDFTRPLAAGQKLEMGAKASRVVSDNNSQFFFNNDARRVPDLNRTNHFVYDENIYAAYLNLNTKLSKNYTLQAGLRAEQTTSRGESLTTGQVTDRQYLNFFPSIFVQQNVSDDYQVNYSYSRRIQRPNYGNLNPFISYRDPYTYIQGNPYLRPQYAHAFGITQTLKKTYSLVLNYQLTQDVISELPILDVENATTIYTTGNVDDAQSLSMTAIAPYKIMKNWETSNTFVLSYNKFSMLVAREQVVNEQVFYMLQSNQNIVLPKGLRLEVNAAYRGPAASGLYHIAPMWWVHLGLKKSLLKDKLDVTINANDIFKTYRLRFTTDISGNINEFDQYFRNRTIGLTLRYKFSKGAKVDERRRNTTLDELNRTGG